MNVKYLFLPILLTLNNSLTQSQEIYFYTVGNTFSPIINVEDGAAVRWIFQDGSESNSTNPVKDYGSDGNRLNKLIVTPWSALKSINIGYDGSDGGSDTIPINLGQGVYKVENLELAAQSLEIWCSSYSLMDSLNFDNFVNLKIIECYSSNSIKQVSLKNTPSLKRICLEDNDLTSLDLSESTGLEDLRSALNNYNNVIFSNSTEELWHLCIRDIPVMQNSYLYTDLQRFPAIKDLLIWNTNQKGNFELHSTSSKEMTIYAYNNFYTSLDFSGSLTDKTSWADIDFSSNLLESVNVAGCFQIYNLKLQNNKLLPESVDAVLRQLDELGPLEYTEYRRVDLRNNSVPTITGMMHKSNLDLRGWTISVQTGAELNVYGNENRILYNDTIPSSTDSTNFDSLIVSTGNTIRSYRIINSGNELLFIDSVYFSKSFVQQDFTISRQPENIVLPGDTTFFQITFKPEQIGLHEADILIRHNGANKNPFLFRVQGTGVPDVSSADEPFPLINEYLLYQNYPNPFNPNTNIVINIPFTSRITLKIFDVLGKEITILSDEEKAPGVYHFNWNASTLPGGVYFCQMLTKNFTQTNKMILLK